MSAHVADRAAGIMSLPAEDPERAAALSHAATCPSCAMALDEARQVLALLDELPPPAPPSSHAIERTVGAVRAELTRERAPLRGPGAAVVLVALVLTAAARDRAHDALAWYEALGAVVVAFGAATVGSRWARRSIVTALGASIGLVALGATGSGWAAMIGLKCVVVELVAAAAPYGALAWLMFKRRLPVTAQAYAAVASAGALAGQATLQLTCKAHGPTGHLVAFHLGGVLLATALGALGGRVLVRRAATS